MTRGEWLKSQRHKQGLSVPQAAAIVKVTPRSWSRWEAGDREPPAGAVELFALKTGAKLPSSVA